MVETILLDADVLVDFFRGYSKAVAFVNANSTRIILSSIVVAELYAGVKGDAEKAVLENFTLPYQDGMKVSPTNVLFWRKIYEEESKDAARF